jgi:predicted ATPase
LLELLFATNEYDKDYAVDTPHKTSFTQSTKENFWDKSIINQPFIFRKENGQFLDVKFGISIEIGMEYMKSQVSSFDQILNEYPSSKANTVEIEFKGSIEQLGIYQAQQKLESVLLNNSLIYEIDEIGTPLTFPNKEELSYNDFESLMTVFNDCVMLLDNDRYFTNEQQAITQGELNPKTFKNHVFDLYLSHLREEDFLELNRFLKSFAINSSDAVFQNNEKSSPFNNFKFEFVRYGSEIEVMLSNDFGRLPISSFGTGVQQVIYILTKIFLSSKKIVLIEEIELNLSPKYQTELVSFLKEKIISSGIITQAFFTTHSPIMCFKTDFRTLQARIDNSGVSSIKKLTPKKEDIEVLGKAMSVLEHYHPPSK